MNLGINSLIDNIILSIASFNLQIYFHPTERYNMRNKMIDEILTHFNGFIIKKNPKKIDFTIDFIVNERADIIFDKNTQRNFINFYEHESATKLTSYYQIGIFQFQIVLIKILHKLLAKNNGFLLHASANNINHQAMLFLGDHGSGKSTIMKFLNDKYPALADDSVIVKKESENYYLYQTPFIEKENWFKRESSMYEIKNVFFLRKSDYYKIEKIKNKESLIQKMLKVFWTLDNNHRYQLTHILKFIDNFNSFHNLYFGQDKHQVIKLLDNFRENDF